MRIEGIIGPNANKINGIYHPVSAAQINADEFQIYKKDENVWLYQVNNLWWVGTKDNMRNRRAWGFLRQRSTGTVNPVQPWEVTQWRYWHPASPLNNTNGPTGAWKSSINIKITLLNPENILKKKYKEKENELSQTYELSFGLLEMQKIENAKQVENYKKVSEQLFNHLSKEDRLRLIEKPSFRNLFKNEQLCSCCFGAGKIITKCIHIDCPGACETCRGTDKDKDCCACGKEQKLQCPICFDTFPPSFMNIFGCKHGICWKCYSKAFECNKPIKKCPMCRENINFGENPSTN